MKRFINFGSIEQLRSVVMKMSHQAHYTGQDENDEPVYNKNLKMPTIVAQGTEKIHGTNGSVCYSIPDGFWVQSKNNIITPEKDNSACAFFAEQNKEAWMEIIETLAEEWSIDLNKNIITVFFEWAGGNIQKKSALTGLEKGAMIFQHFKVSPIEPITDVNGQEVSAVWRETEVEFIPTGQDFWIENRDANIYNIMNFPTVQVEIDFEHPQMSQNNMIEMVEKLEESSPVGERFGIKGNIGEGLVFTFEYKGSLHRFKVKGEKHANSKVKTLKPVDEAKEQVKIDFANSACAAVRLEQAWQTTFGIENEKSKPTIALTGTFLRAVITDVMKEEQDIMAEKGLEPKDVNGMISKVARQWFMEELDKEAGF